MTNESTEDVLESPTTVKTSLYLRCGSDGRYLSWDEVWSDDGTNKKCLWESQPDSPGYEPSPKNYVAEVLNAMVYYQGWDPEQYDFTGLPDYTQEEYDKCLKCFLRERSHRPGGHYYELKSQADECESRWLSISERCDVVPIQKQCRRSVDDDRYSASNKKDPWEDYGIGIRGI